MQQTYSSTTEFLQDQRVFSMDQVRQKISQATISEYPYMEQIRNKLKNLDGSVKVTISSLKSKDNDKVIFADGQYKGQQVHVGGTAISLHLDDRLKLFRDVKEASIAESVSRKRITEAQIRKVIREELIKFLEEAKLTEPVEIGAITVNELIKAEKIGKEGKQYADPTTGIRRPAELSFPVLLRSIKNKDEKMPIYKNNFGIVYVKVPYTDEGGQMDLTLDGDVKPIVKQMRLIKEE